jgi:hypothetical protein
MDCREDEEMKNNEPDVEGNNYYIHVDGLHYGAAKNMDEAMSLFECALKEANGQVIIETRDYWMNSVE